MAKITIKIEKEVNLEKWYEFLHRTGNNNLFSFPEYYEIQKAKIFFITAYCNDNIIVGGAVCRIRGALFPFSFLSKSLWIESGLLIEKSNPAEDEELKRELFHFIEREAKRQKCILIRLNRWFKKEKQGTLVENGFRILPRSTFISDLTIPSEYLYKKLDRKAKAAIKKAKEHNLNFNVVKGNNPDIVQNFYKLYKSTHKRAVNSDNNVSMTLKSQDFILEIMQQEKLNCYLSYVQTGDKHAAGLIMVKNGETILSYIAGSDIDLNRQSGASSYLFWESMLWAKQHGIKYFDFGGVPNNHCSKDPAYGVYQFKKKLGGELVDYAIGVKILIPWKAKLFEHILNRRIIIRFLMNLSNKF